LPGGIDGLVHLSDLSWSTPGEEAVRNFKKGEEVEAQVLSIDVERERISLGHQAARGRSVQQFRREPREGQAHLRDDQVGRRQGRCRFPRRRPRGYLRASEISRDRVEDARTHLKEGDSVNAMIINVDRKNRTINLSVKQKDLADENAAMGQAPERKRREHGKHQPRCAPEGQARQ